MAQDVNENRDKGANCKYDEDAPNIYDEVLVDLNSVDTKTIRVP